MGSGFDNDPHSQAGSPCPKNSFGITNYLELQPLETVFVLKRTVELANNVITGRFDSGHLHSLHLYLFQDVFPWAGEFRVVNISKGNSNFAPAVFIDAALADALAKLKSERFLVGLSSKEFSSRAAFYLSEFNAIHPFREGNGRAQREFLRQLAISAGHPLSWAGFNQQQMIDASVASHLRGDYSQLAAIIEAALFSSRQIP